MPSVIQQSGERRPDRRRTGALRGGRQRSDPVQVPRATRVWCRAVHRGLRGLAGDMPCRSR